MQAISLLLLMGTMAFTNAAGASLSCAMVFGKKSESTLDIFMNELFEVPYGKELEAAARQKERSNDIDKANDSTHEMVVIGNRMLDSLVENIIETTFGNLPTVMRGQKQRLSTKIIQYLNDLIRVDSDLLELAIETRLNQYMREHQELVESAKEGISIGFAIKRTDSEATESMVIDFGFPTGASKKVESDANDSVPLGFDLNHRNDNAEASGHAIGFGRRHQKKEDFEPTHDGPLGFDTVSKAKDSDLPNQIDVDLDTGLFVLKKAHEL